VGKRGGPGRPERQWSQQPKSAGIIEGWQLQANEKDEGMDKGGQATHGSAGDEGGNLANVSSEGEGWSFLLFFLRNP